MRDFKQTITGPADVPRLMCNKFWISLTKNKAAPTAKASRDPIFRQQQQQQCQVQQERNTQAFADHRLQRCQHRQKRKTKKNISSITTCNPAMPLPHRTRNLLAREGKGGKVSRFRKQSNKIALCFLTCCALCFAMCCVVCTQLRRRKGRGKLFGFTRLFWICYTQCLANTRFFVYFTRFFAYFTREEPKQLRCKFFDYTFFSDFTHNVWALTR